MALIFVGFVGAHLLCLLFVARILKAQRKYAFGAKPAASGS